MKLLSEIGFTLLFFILFFTVLGYAAIRYNRPHNQYEFRFSRPVPDSVARPFVDSSHPDSLQWRLEPRINRSDAQ